MAGTRRTTETRAGKVGAKPKRPVFAPLVPNSETVEAMKAARRGELTKVSRPDEPLGSRRAKAGNRSR